MRALEYLYHGDMHGMDAINKALVSLLMKKDDVVDLRDFESVSLVHGTIKIFDKVLPMS